MPFCERARSVRFVRHSRPSIVLIALPMKLSTTSSRKEDSPRRIAILPTRKWLPVLSHLRFLWFDSRPETAFAGFLKSPSSRSSLCGYRQVPKAPEILAAMRFSDLHSLWFRTILQKLTFSSPSIFVSLFLVRYSSLRFRNSWSPSIFEIRLYERSRATKFGRSNRFSILVIWMASD